MSTDDPIDTFVLQEFRLHTAASAGEAARIVATFAGGNEPAVPLLTSIDDRCDVATVRAMHAGEKLDADPRERSALEPLVASWQPPRQYGPRITEHSARPPTHYRLAVTESGVTNGDAGRGTPAVTDLNVASNSTQLSLLWIGLPVGTHAGLLTLVGSEDQGLTKRPEPRMWPLPFSRLLGVRIYESRD